MSESQPPLSAIIAKTLYSNDEISHSDLARLSNLNDDDLSQYKRAWNSAHLERRALIISKLRSMGEDDARLDFTRIFKFCLDDIDAGIRIKALEGLELEDKYNFALPVIKTLKMDESPEVREAAARVMGKFALMAELGELPAAVGDDIFDALLGVLENPSEPDSLRRRALESISPFRQEPVASYIEDFYFSENPALKASAIFAMGRNCDTRWLDYLNKELQDSNARFRCEAARACGDIEEEDTVPGLLNLLNDVDHDVQEAAIAALGKIGGQKARDALSKLKTSPENRIKEAAMSALTELEICQDPLSSSS
ncbi:MAG: HEAT repeat domain-containing protein [Dehalococcoidia bacterium]|jgi:HEAT repeat protein